MEAPICFNRIKNDTNNLSKVSMSAYFDRFGKIDGERATVGCYRNDRFKTLTKSLVDDDDEKAIGCRLYPQPLDLQFFVHWSCKR